MGTVSEIAEAFYLPLGEGRFAPTKATESPWDTDAQHGGPPSALLAHLAGAGADPGQRTARVSVDFLGAIPRRELTVEVHVVRPGRRISLTEARMTVDGRAVAVARVWHLATGPTPPQRTPVVVPAQGPEQPDAPTSLLPAMGDWGDGKALDWRYTTGVRDGLGPAGLW